MELTTGVGEVSPVLLNNFAVLNRRGSQRIEVLFIRDQPSTPNRRPLYELYS